VNLIFEERRSDAPFVEKVWRTHSEQPGSFISQAESHWEMVITNYQGKTTFTVRGPETKASSADYPAEAEFFGIVFKLGTFMPHLSFTELLDRQDKTLPEATSHSFWLNGSVWQLPDFDNADTFVARLVRQEILVPEPVVEAVLQNQPVELSLRSVQRRFLRATGLTYGTLDQIERAREAATLLEQGISIADAVYYAGYADQPHLTRSLKRFVGQTPGQILRIQKDYLEQP
jgi:AraC-like DNA-binding protein